MWVVREPAADEVDPTEARKEQEREKRHRERKEADGYGYGAGVDAIETDL